MTAYVRVTPSPADPDPDGILSLTRDDVGRRTVLCASGEIDIATAPTLARAIDAALAAGALELWIDLTPASFMDSSGVHVLFETHTRLCDLNRRLAVVCPPGSVRRVLDLSGVSERLPLYEDRAAAHRGAPG
jgi:anti-sigma B factor antagonist